MLHVYSHCHNRLTFKHSLGKQGICTTKQFHSGYPKSIPVWFHRDSVGNPVKILSFFSLLLPLPQYSFPARSLASISDDVIDVQTVMPTGRSCWLQWVHSCSRTRNEFKMNSSLLFPPKKRTERKKEKNFTRQCHFLSCHQTGMRTENIQGDGSHSVRLWHVK